MLLWAALASCGGKAQSSPADDAGNSSACAEPCSPWLLVLPDGGAMLGDAFTPPSNPVLECDGGTTVSIVLPCELGQAPIHELECHLDNGVDGFVVDFFPEAHGDRGPGSLLDLTKYMSIPSSHFPSMILQGMARVIEYHSAERTLLGELSDLSLALRGYDAGAGTVCHLKKGPLWTIPGEFL
jgi:hypothetical protein